MNLRHQWRMAYRACRQDGTRRPIMNRRGVIVAYASCGGMKPHTLMTMLAHERAEAHANARLWVRGVLQEWLWNGQRMPCDREEARHWIKEARRHNRLRPFLMPRLP